MITIYPRDVACYTFAKQISIILNFLIHPLGHTICGSLYVSGNLPTYPSPKPIFCPNLEVSVNIGLGEG